MKEWYWITDGRGRQFATGAADGTLGSIPSTEYTENGGSYAGGTQNANTFKADRFSSSVLPALSFFRNRVYDQQTGRWSQGDPAGIAGGLNLYSFNGNNQVMFTDPFGLDPCKLSGNCTQTQDGNDKASAYLRRDDAAKAGMQSVEAISVSQNIEYAAELQQVTPGEFTYAPGRPQGTASGTINSGVPAYEGYYHSHGANSNGVYDDNNFSGADKDVADNHGKPAYLITPSGDMKRYDPDPNKKRGGPVTGIGTAHP